MRLISVRFAYRVGAFGLARWPAVQPRFIGLG
jgi:hypothetical protein